MIALKSLNLKRKKPKSDKEMRRNAGSLAESAIKDSTEH